MSDLTMEAVCVSPGDYQTESKWIITLKRGNIAEQFDWSQGCGHRVVTYTRGSDGMKIQGFKRGERVPFLWGRKTAEQLYVLKNHTAPSPPKMMDVVECLLSDADCGTETFDDFCANFGYDTDSRKALETYLACQANREKLQRLGGVEHFRQLWEATQAVSDGL